MELVETRILFKTKNFMVLVKRKDRFVTVPKLETCLKWIFFLVSCDVFVWAGFVVCVHICNFVENGQCLKAPFLIYAHLWFKNSQRYNRKKNKVFPSIYSKLGLFQKDQCQKCLNCKKENVFNTDKVSPSQYEKSHYSMQKKCSNEISLTSIFSCIAVLSEEKRNWISSCLTRHKINEIHLRIQTSILL